MQMGVRADIQQILIAAMKVNVILNNSTNGQEIKLWP